MLWIDALEWTRMWLEMFVCLISGLALLVSDLDEQLVKWPKCSFPASIPPSVRKINPVK